MNTTQVVVALAGGAAAGSVLTGIVTVVTTVLNRHHEHRRWLLDKRMDVYTALLEGWDEFMKGRTADTDRERFEQIQVVNTTPCLLIASPQVQRTVAALDKTLADYVTDGHLASEALPKIVAVQDAMRRDLLQLRSRPTRRGRSGGDRSAGTGFQQHSA